MNTHHHFFVLHEPPPELAAHTILRIRAHERALNLRRLRISAALCGVLIMTTIYFMRSLVSTLAKSELFYYWQLLVSDPLATLSAWRDFALSVLESLPIDSLLLTFVTAALAAYLGFFYRMTRGRLTSLNNHNLEHYAA